MTDSIIPTAPAAVKNTPRTVSSIATHLAGFRDYLNSEKTWFHPIRIRNSMTRYDSDRAVIFQNRGLHVIDTGKAILSHRRVKLVVRDLRPRQNVFEHVTVMHDD